MVAAVELRDGTNDIGVVRESLHRPAPALTAAQVSGLCQHVCWLLTMHHTIEDQSMFPAVATLDACAPVAARLAAKHSTYEETEMTEPLGLLGLGI